MLDNNLGLGEDTNVKTDAEPIENSCIELYRSRLGAAVSSRNSKKLLGKVSTNDEVNKMDPDQVTSLYKEYTTRMGRSMGSGLSQMTTSAYTGLVKRFFSVIDHAVVKNNLTITLSSILLYAPFFGEIYHCFGLGVIPLTLMLCAVQHVDGTRPTWVAQRDQKLNIRCPTSAAQPDELHSTIEDLPQIVNTLKWKKPLPT